MRTGVVLGITLFVVGILGLSGCGSKGVVITGEVVYPEKKAEGDTWSVTLTDGDKTASFSASTDASFKAENVMPGTYTLKVIHYAVGGDPKKGRTPPSQKEYPEKWSVPGGPYKLDLNKLAGAAKK
jgi:hypothetical protein